MVRRLLLLNGLSVLGAVVFHATGWGYTALFWWTDRYAPVARVPDFSQIGSAGYYALRLIEQIVVLGVPAFLFVSGYFVAFASGRARRFEPAMVAARLKTLLPPFLLWSILILAVRYAEGTVAGPAVFLRRLLLGQAAEPFYYVPVLTQLFMLAPAIVWALGRWPVATLVAAGLVQGMAQAVRYPILLGLDWPWAAWAWQHLPSWFFPHLAFWFTFGVFAGLHWPAVSGWLGRVRPMLPWLAAALAIAALLEWEGLLWYSNRPWIAATTTLLDSAYAGAAILAFLARPEATVPARAWFEALGERSYGVYLVHAPVLEVVARGTYHGAPGLLAHPMLLQLALVACGVGVPLLLMAIVNRSPVRPAYKLVFG